MSKTRLTSHTRGILSKLARDLVVAKRERVALDKAYVAAAKLVRRAVEKALPPADMEVLKKYDASCATTSIRLRLTAGGIVEFIFGPDDGPLSMRHRIFLEDVVAVWPEAESVRARMAVTAIVAFPAEVAARIQADVRERAKAA